MVTHDAHFRRPTTYPLRPTVVEVLPEENPSPYLPDQYEPLVEFLAYVKSSHIGISGELQISIGVPYEYKYHAIQLTDMRGVQFRVIVEKPKLKDSAQGQGELEEGDDDG